MLQNGTKLLSDFMKDKIKKEVEKARNGEPDPNAGHGDNGQHNDFKPSKVRGNGAIDMEKYSKFTHQK